MLDKEIKETDRRRTSKRARRHAGESVVLYVYDGRGHVYLG